jgi:D-3-phosphoglycerate dehydrogenase
LKGKMDLKQCRVLVTPTSYGKNDRRLMDELEATVGEVIYNTTGKPLASAHLKTLLPGVHGYIAGLDEIDREALETADHLKVISRYGVGVDNVDLETACKKGIVITNTPGANSVSVAELALALILALLRHLPEAINATRRSEWPRLSGVSLEGKTVGVLGLGSIGKELARRLAGFRCRVLAFDPYPDMEFANRYGVTYLPMEELLQNSDIISLNLPLLPETRGLVNDEFLNKVKKGAYLVNTARGEVVDEDALLRALQSGKLRGAALDAFSQEPPNQGNPLLVLPQVLVTPHMGAHADWATNNMGWMAMRDCLAVLRGEKPKFPVA